MDSDSGQPLVGERFRLQSLIGSGGTGAVWRALDLKRRRAVAVKMIAPSRREGALKRFEREADALRQVQHAGIVRLLGHGVDRERDQVYLVMELIVGRSLQEALADGSLLPVTEVAGHGRLLAEALATVHAAGLLHRDVKPGNVLLEALPDGGERARLIDFGLTRAIDRHLSHTSLTPDGTFMGSPGYWAPEQARGDNHAVGAPSDVYGLAATLYQALTGRSPQGEITSMAEAVVAWRREYPRPREVRPETPPALEAAILAGLDQNPRRRPTARQLAETLAELSGELRGRRSAASVPLMIGAGLGGLALGAALAAASSGLGGRPTPPASPGPPSEASVGPAVAAFPDRPAGSAPASPTVPPKRAEQLRGGSPRVREALLQAGELRQGKRYAEARQAYDLAVDLAETPLDRGSALYERGRFLLARGELDAARSDLTEVRGLDVAWSREASLCLAEIATRQDRPQSALEYAREVLARTPDDLGAREQELRALGSLGRLNEALSRADALLKLDPERPLVRYFQSRYLLELGRYSSALQAARAGLELPRQTRESAGVLPKIEVSALMRLERYPEALQATRRWRSVRPDLPETIAAESNVLLAMGEVEEALQVAEAGLQQRPAHMDLLRARATALLRQDQEAGLEALREACRQHPREVVVLNDAAHAHLQAGRLEQARALSERAVAADPLFPVARLTLAETLLAQDRLSEAWAVISESFGLFPEHPPTRAFRAELQELRQLAPQEPH